MGTRHEGTEEEIRALDTYIKLVRATNAVTTHAHRHLALEQLTISQFGALEALFHLGPMCQRDLGKKLLKTGGNITLVVDNLEKRGLVSRVRDTNDRRYVTVHLTAKGRDLIGRIFPRHAAAVLEAMAGLAPSDQDELAGLCRALGIHAAERT